MKLYEASLICQDRYGDTKFVTIELSETELADFNEHQFDSNKYLPEDDMTIDDVKIKEI